jgi:hypothetical protein
MVNNCPTDCQRRLSIVIFIPRWRMNQSLSRKNHGDRRALDASEVPLLAQHIGRQSSDDNQAQDYSLHSVALTAAICGRRPEI